MVLGAMVYRAHVRMQFWPPLMLCICLVYTQTVSFSIPWVGIECNDVDQSQPCEDKTSCLLGTGRMEMGLKLDGFLWSPPLWSGRMRRDKQR